jgi:syndecan 4
LIDISYVNKNISGDLMNILFLGNEHVHQPTAQGKYSLRINMEDFDNNEKYAKYKQFAVSDEKSVYKLTIGGYQGDAGET